MNSVMDMRIARNCEERRYAAMLAADVNSLERLMADELIYGHANGTLDTKRSLLGRISAKDIVFETIEHTQDAIVARSGVAIISGTITGRARFFGNPLPINNRTLTVWLRTGDSWLCSAYQPTPIKITSGNIATRRQD
jgi:hypothetical protein